MIFIFTIADRYIIGHFQESRGVTAFCSFKENLLPQNARRHLQSLSFFNLSAKHTYSLNAKQNREAYYIFYKMKQEHNSSYAFSEMLQQTYLLELLHFITKLQQQHTYDEQIQNN